MVMRGKRKYDSAVVFDRKGGSLVGKKTRYERTKEYKNLRQSMVSEMEALGKIAPVYMDQVEEYMALWVQLQAFREDVEKRGVVVMDEKRCQMVENRSASLRLQTSKQMQALRAEMLKVDPARAADGDDDEL